MLLNLIINYLSGEYIYLIVGIDPGIRVGYAALDLDGKLVGSGCTKDKSFDKVIQVINPLGTPCLIASDVSPPPHFAKKIAARFGIKCFHPRKSLSKEQKRIIGNEIVNAHIRDAYAAAVKAYRHYSNRFRRIDKIYPEKKEQYKHLLLKGVAVGKL